MPDTKKGGRMGTNQLARVYSRKPKPKRWNRARTLGNFGPSHARRSITGCVGRVPLRGSSYDHLRDTESRVVQATDEPQALEPLEALLSERRSVTNVRSGGRFIVFVAAPPRTPYPARSSRAPWPAVPPASASWASLPACRARPGSEPTLPWPSPAWRSRPSTP